MKKQSSKATNPPSAKRNEILAKTQARRDFIREAVSAEGEEIEFQKVRDKHPVSDTTLYNDANYFQDNSIPIIARDHKFVYSENYLSTITRRTLEDPAAKQAIANLASEIILSPRRDSATPDDRRRKQSNFEADRFVNLPLSAKSTFRPTEHLQWKLNAYWRKAHRLVILDAGSTTAAIAAALAPVRTPDEDRALSELRILTNGKTVLDELDSNTCNHGLLPLGGALRRDTEAVAGELATRCFEAWSVQADLSVLGTTNLRHDFSCCSDSESESGMKSRFLAAADIRCVAASAKKLIGSSGVSAWPFASLSSEFIDIIITDETIHDKQPIREFEDRRKEFLSRAEATGVYVAVARPSQSD